MKTETFNLTAEDNTAIVVYSWLPDERQNVKGVIQVVHGMAEHAARYDDFARFMVAAGYAVFANDHRGHGKTAGTVENTGIIAGVNSWLSVLGDLKLLNREIHKAYDDFPIIMLGLSMGSFYTRAYLEKYPETISGAVISGTAWHPALLLCFGLTVAKLQCFFKGEKNRSKLLDKLSFGAFNNKFKPCVTPFDWLSRDAEVCKKYTDDDFCGWVATSSFFRELFRLLKFIHKPDLYRNVDKKIPILLIAGEKDPVGNFSEGPQKMFSYLKSKNFSNTELKLYAGARHEVLNELNKAEVYKDVLEWIQIVVSS